MLLVLASFLKARFLLLLRKRRTKQQQLKNVVVFLSRAKVGLRAKV